MAPKHEKILNTTDTIAERFTAWLGSPLSIVIHTIVFIAAFVFVLFGVPFDSVLLILTTAVSLEAIYLSLFIQMSVNRNTKSMAEIEEDIEEIAEDVEGIEKDIDEIEKDNDEDDLHDAETMKTLTVIQANMLELMKDIQALKQQKK